jgi:hypothetical protein
MAADHRKSEDVLRRHNLSTSAEFGAACRCDRQKEDRVSSFLLTLRATIAGANEIAPNDATHAFNRGD